MEEFNDVRQGIEHVTPDMARVMLEANEANRSVRYRVVDKYARDMTAGRWHYAGDPIRFAEDGTLLDGQHRLRAIVKSGKSQPMLVIRGLPREAQSVMDTGARRTAADAVRFQSGGSGAPALAAVARLILTSGEEDRSVQPSNVEIAEIVESDATLKWVMTGGLAPLGALRKKVTPAILGYAYWRCHQVDAFAAAEFFERLASLSDLPTGSPILALNDRFVTLARTGRSRGRDYRLDALASIFTAWNAWRKGEDRQIIRPSRLDGRIYLPDLV